LQVILLIVVFVLIVVPTLRSNLVVMWFVVKIVVAPYSSVPHVVAMSQAIYAFIFK
jgi:hypothetical protein